MFGHIERSNNKFIYARSESTLADDMNQTTSVCFPVSALRGFRFTSSSIMTMRYESPYQYAMEDNADCDGIIITLTSTNVHRTFVEDFTRELAFGENQLIVLCDNVTGEKFSNVSTCGIASDIGAD